MGKRTPCPACVAEGKKGLPTYRVYTQVPKRRNDGSTFSTSVELDYIVCGTPTLRNGKGGIAVRADQHGVVAVVRKGRRSKKTEA